MKTLGGTLIVIGFLLLALKHAPAQSNIIVGLVCVSDAFKFCPKAMSAKQLMPDAVEACLRAHEKEISAPCRAALKGHR